MQTNENPFLFCFYTSYNYSRASLVAQMVKDPPAMQEIQIQPLGWEEPLEKGMAI